MISTKPSNGRKTGAQGPVGFIRRLLGDENAFFEENGYLVIDPEIPMSVLDGAIADLEQAYGKEDIHDTNRRIQHAWKISSNVKAIALAPKILAVLHKLYGRKPLPFQTLNFRVGSEQAVHSDTIHFNSDPSGFMAGVWVALEDIDMENGPLVYYPGSNKMPEYNMADINLPASRDHYPHYERFITGLIKGAQLKPKYATVKKGQCFIWAANLLHGGSLHKDKTRTRHSQVTHIFFEGCEFYTPLFTEKEKVYWKNTEFIV